MSSSTVTRHRVASRRLASPRLASPRLASLRFYIAYAPGAAPDAAFATAGRESEGAPTP